jgi:hypothetical protein
MSTGSTKASLIVALDFDGVVVTNEFPDIGQRIGAEWWIPRMQLQYGIRVILWTVRADNRLLAPIGVQLNPDIEENLRGDFLTPAVEECKAQGIKLWATNYNPEQRLWSPSPKVYADVYIDDRNLGAPLIKLKSCDKPVINWDIMGPKLDKLCYRRLYPEGETGIYPDIMS